MTHVTVIFFLYILHSSLLFIAPCAALLPSPLREGGIKSAKLGTKSGHESYFGKCPRKSGRNGPLTLRDVGLDWVVCEANRV